MAATLVARRAALGCPSGPRAEGGCVWGWMGAAAGHVLRAQMYSNAKEYDKWSREGRVASVRKAGAALHRAARISVGPGSLPGAGRLFY